MAETILDGGSATQQNQYTGVENELTVDQSNRELRLQDGVTPGGHIIQNRDSADERYHPKSNELLGLQAFEGQAKGLVTRLGPATYVLRSLTVNSDQLTIANANGHDGNPLLGLAVTIQTDHQWTGEHIFHALVEFGAGINADTAGTHTGPVDGDVVGDLLGDSEGSHVGAVDIRGEVFQYDDEQIDYTRLANLPALPNPIPTGGIIMWSGDASDIPTGWTLCDGTVGTPDLRNQFIIGAGDDYDAHDIGGDTQHNHTIAIEADGVHAHTGTVLGHILVTSEIPAHNHKSGVCDNSSSDVFNRAASAVSPATANSIESNSADGTFEGTTSDTGGGTAHDHGLTIDDSGSHTHDVTPEVANHMPPFYALCFIMKL